MSKVVKINFRSRSGSIVHFFFVFFCCDFHKWLHTNSPAWCGNDVNTSISKLNGSFQEPELAPPAKKREVLDDSNFEVYRPS